MNERSGNSGGSVEAKGMPDTAEIMDMVMADAVESLYILFTKERDE